MASFLDITERKRAEQAVEEEQARLQAVFDNIPVAVGFTDKKGGVVIENGMLEKFWKGRPGVRGVSDYAQYQAFWPDTGELVKPEEWPAARALMGEASTATFDILKFDGSIGTLIVSAKPILADRGKITGTVWMVQDITESREAEEALKESEERFKALANNIPQLAWMTDEIGYIFWYNQRWYDYTGTTLDEMKGWGWQKVHHPDYVDKVTEKFRDHVEKGEAWEDTFPLRGKDGNYRWFLSRAFPIRDESGKIVRWFGSNTDITEELDTQRNLARSNAELQQFAYVSSHDLQEPLRMVISYLSLLDRKYKDQLDPKAQEYIHYAVDGGKRMRELIDDLLEYSRIETKGRKFAPVAMNEVVEDVIKVLKVPIEESKAKIVVGPLPTIMADGTQMAQVMQNLLSNAIKFHGPERPIVHISASQAPREWVFAVKDNGIGLNMEHTTMLFQMFQRLHTRSEYPGTGVGLAIAKKIVERHGGRILVESEEGKGATFYFTIPKAGGRIE